MKFQTTEVLMTKTTFGVLFFSGNVSGRRYDVNSIGLGLAERVAMGLADDGGVALPVKGMWRGEGEQTWLVAVNRLQDEELKAMAAGLARMFEQETVIFGELEFDVAKDCHLTSEQLVNSLDTVEAWNMVDGRGHTVSVATSSNWMTYEEASVLDGWTDIDGEAFVIDF